MEDLFSHSLKENQQLKPLAEQLRPRDLDQVVGQKTLLKDQGLFKRITQGLSLPSLILWGPPGCGKTTLARILAQKSGYEFFSLSAVLAGVKDLREIVEKAREALKYHQKKSVLFIDEIHRFNKAQQDALLPHVEDGTLTLIGATTENPSFEVINPLLSRSRVIVLEALSKEDLAQVLARALKKIDKSLSQEAKQALLEEANGDARRLLNTLEVAANLSADTKEINLQTLQEAAQSRSLNYDKDGEDHYNLISAFIKSMRASQADATVYYLARMYEAGEDPRFLARRMIIFASEDIGLADKHALLIAVAAAQAFDHVGIAEGWINLSHAAIYLAQAPKSNASYQAYQKAKEALQEMGPLPVPLHLRNAPTQLMKELNYGKGYAYAHSNPEGSAKMECLPEKLIGKKFLKEKLKK
ncbi:MAG: replication-associated recombination protein A [Deltaproteobacteria bacterium]|nr:replication-associated recombination protein A [Deltaproteobacteria bacterium]